MQPFFETYLDRMEFLHKEVERALSGLPQAALDWTPGPEMSSLAVLAMHLAGSEQFRIGDLTGRGASQRNRDAEFQTRNVTGELLIQRLTSVLADSRSTLETLTMEDLATMRVSPDDGKTYTVAWLLNQTLMHIALHVGHMQMMRQLWDQQVEAKLNAAGNSLKSQ